MPTTDSYIDPLIETLMEGQYCPVNLGAIVEKTNHGK
jgi:hypothetical protein